MSSALWRSAAIIFFATLPPLVARSLAALLSAILLMLVGAAPAAAQKYAQIVHTEEPYASAGIYIRYGSQFESLFDRSFGRTAVQLLNRMADAQKNCDFAAWNRAVEDFRKLIHISYDYATSLEATRNRLLAPYQGIRGFLLPPNPHPVQESQLYAKISEANADNRTLHRLYDSIPPWQPCGRKTQAQLPPAPAPKPKPTFLEEYPPSITPPVPPPLESPVRPQDQVMMGGPGIFGPGAQPFVGVNVSGGFQNTNFSVSDTGFNVNGTGVMGGGFAGVLLPIPNTNAMAGFRVGGEGGNITGDIRMPALSPRFNYTVKTDATLYQEAVISIPALSLAPRFVFVGTALEILDLNARLSAGVAESHTSVNGTAGAFSVTDSNWRPGITFTAGVAKPIAILANGGVVDLFAQYRGTQFISTVNIPGGVNIGSFTNEVDVGVTLNFGGGVSWTLR
jgi:hypothetical protein